MIKKLVLTRYVSFIKHLAVDELVQLINLADVCVHPATHEGFCLAVLEEMACGKPVVAFDCSSMPEIIDDRKNGILVEIANTEKLALAINELLDSNQLAKALGKRTREKIEKKFLWSRSALRLLRIYEKLCDIS